jgi:hypothetical protein
LKEKRENRHRRKVIHEREKGERYIDSREESGKEESERNRKERKCVKGRKQKRKKTYIQREREKRERERESCRDKDKLWKRKSKS